MVKATLFLTVYLAAACLSFAQGFGSSQLLHDWDFHLGDDLTPSSLDTSSDEIWRQVTVPHDWSVEYPASPDHASCTGYLPGGIGWYRTHLEIPETKTPKRFYLYFEGVYNRSEVYVNGQLVGKRPNGYVSFLYDITEYLKTGKNNRLAVKVDHSLSADSRWYTGSGIYRPVHLITANPIHLGLWGVHYWPELGEDGNAQIVINTQLQKNLPQSKGTTDVTIIHELYDATHKKVGQSETSIAVKTGDGNHVQSTITIANPEFWSVEHPYLYSLKTTVLAGSQELDTSSTSVGIRTLTFDPDKGFALNGDWMKLKGVCLHHDAGVLGAAVPKVVWRERLLKLKEIGCNAIRMSHNPQATALYDLCDELGFLVMDEAFDEWEYPKKKWLVGWNKGEPGFQGSADFFEEWAERDLAAMVMRDRNHPSIIMWSIGNEVDYPNDPYSHPILDKEGIGQQHVAGYQKDQPPAERLGEISHKLAAVVRKHDTSRPVTAALAGAVMSNETTYPDALDIVGYNYTENRYEMDHQKYPQRVLYGSETRHDYNAWKAVRDNEYIFGQFLWTGFDYLGEAGAWPSRGFTTGLIDLANNIKPRGYFRRALWADSPVAYLGTYRPRQANSKYVSMDAGKSWDYQEGETVRAVCYTNCDTAALKLNGTMVGEPKAPDPDSGIIYWDIPYQSGKLDVLAYNKKKVAARDSVQTAAPAVSMKVDESLSSLNGKYAVAVVPVSAVDKTGALAYGYDGELTCELNGPGKLLGIENASPNASDNFHDNKAAFKNGRLTLYIQATSDKGQIELILSTSDLKTKKVQLPIKAH